MNTNNCNDEKSLAGGEGEDRRKTAVVRNDGKAKDEEGVSNAGNKRKPKAEDNNNDNSNHPFGLGPPEKRGKLRSASQQKMNVDLEEKLSKAKAREAVAEGEKRQAEERLKKEEEAYLEATRNLSDGDEMFMDTRFVGLARHMEIYDACYEGSCGTVDLSNNPNMLHPNSDFAFKNQTVSLNASQCAIKIWHASMNNSHVEDMGYILGSMGQVTNKRGEDVDQALSAVKKNMYERHVKENKGLAKVHSERDKQFATRIPEIAFTSGDVELYDESDQPVTQDMYKHDHKGVRSFVVPDRKAHDRLAIKFAYKGDQRERDNKLRTGLTEKDSKFKFVRERFDNDGTLQGVGPRDKRYQHASYRYTIADKNQFFAPYEDLNIHVWVQCDR
jgi:hypothetical protein